jgi:CRISPR-associated protein Cmr3
VRIEVHLQIDPKTQAALESRLFTREIVETITKEGDRYFEWAIAATAQVPGPCIASPVLLGGDRRLCSLETAEPGLFAMPAGLRRAFDEHESPRLRLVTVTAAGFEEGWIPDFLHREGNAFRGTVADVEVVLRAAVVPQSIDVAGWDMAENRPKPLSRMVPPGSVYFFERIDGRSVDGAFAEKLWLTALGQRRSEGFGLVVPGVWK